MPFYLTTAIDYVNSRPHLGTAYEKITADVIARYKRLTGVPDAFPDGQRRALAERVRKARELGMDPHAYCDQMEQAFREVWAKLSISFDDFIRTTEPRHRAAVQRMAQACYDAGDIYEGALRRLVLRLVRGVQAGEGPGRRQVPDPPRRTPDWIREKNYFFRLSKYQQPLLDHYAAHPGVHPAGDPAQRDPAAGRRRARGHLDLAAPARAGASRCRSTRRQRRLRLVRRADQLRRGRRLRHRRRRCSRTGGRRASTSSARTSRASTASSGRRC